MPSFLELLQSSSGDEPHSSASGAVPLDVLASVRTEGGRRRRRRHRRNLAISGLALVVLAVPALALVGGSDDPQDVRSTDVAGSAEPDIERKRDVASTTSTTVLTEVAGVVIERTPEEAAAESGPTTTATTARPRPTAPPTTAPPTTAPPLVCSNSFDPACGDFSWSPTPAANSPITPSDPGRLTVVRGGTREFDVVWSDPDAVPNYTDDDTDGTIIAAACATDAVRYGPWTPPAATGGSATHRVTYTADDQQGAPLTPGTYFVTVYGSSRNGDCVYDHYGSEGSTTVSIEVAWAS